MTIIERHFKWGWDDKCAIKICAYRPNNGLVVDYGYNAIYQTKVPNSDNVLLARKEAVRYQLNNPNHDVVITIQDADNVPENSRNSPLDGGATPIERDRDGWWVMPKVRGQSPGNLYDWQPLTPRDVEELSVIVRQEEYRKMKNEDKEKKKSKKLR